MSEDLTFSNTRWTAVVEGARYQVEIDHALDIIAWYMPSGDDPYDLLTTDLGSACWPTREAAIEACRKHHALRTGRVSMAPAGAVDVDGDGRAVT
jgi:hypothetical protein